MLKVTITPELAALLVEIDRMKINITPVQQSSKDARERWVREYAENASHHSARLDTYTRKG